MKIKRKIFAALAALALAGGISAAAVHATTASADGGSGTSSSAGDSPGLFPYGAE